MVPDEPQIRQQAFLIKTGSMSLKGGMGRSQAWLNGERNLKNIRVVVSLLVTSGDNCGSMAPISGFLLTNKCLLKSLWC